MESESKEIVTTQPKFLDGIDINLIDADKLKVFMETKFTYEDRENKKLFNSDMMEFQRIAPTIKKTGKVRYSTGKGVTSYNHADLGVICTQIQPLLRDYGFTFRWESGTKEGKIFVSTILTHIAGHSEKTTLEAPSDQSGGKNAVQAIGSSTHYLQRYTLLMSVGMVAQDDDDGRSLSTVAELGKMLREQWTERRRSIEAPEKEDDLVLRRIIHTVLGGQPVRHSEEVNKIHEHIFRDGMFDFLTGDELPPELRVPEPQKEIFE